MRRVFEQKQKEWGEKDLRHGKNSCTHPEGKWVWLPGRPTWLERKRWVGGRGAQDVSDNRLAVAGGTP